MGGLAVYKSTSAEFLDQFFGGSPEELAEQYQRSLELLDSIGDAPLAEAAARIVDDSGLPPESVDDSRTGWRGDKVVDRIIGHAYRHAMTIAGDSARAEPVPIDTLWVTGASDEFEAHVVEGERRVTVVMCIPLDRSYGSERARSRSWAIRAPGEGDEGAIRLDEGDEPIVMVSTSGRDEAATSA
jgi:hypothetical protein